MKLFKQLWAKSASNHNNWLTIWLKLAIIVLALTTCTKAKFYQNNYFAKQQLCKNSEAADNDLQKSFDTDDCQAITCIKNCNNDCRRCMHFAKLAAQKKYFNYRQEQFIKGSIRILQLNSFKDPLQCKKITCDCQEYSRQ